MELSRDPSIFVYMGRCLFQVKPRVETEMNSEIVGHFNKAIQLGVDAEDADSFSEGLAAVRISVKGKLKWGYINMKGEIVIPPA